MSDIITIGWTILFPGNSADSLIILIIILTVLYIIHRRRSIKYVATVEFLKDLDIRDFKEILKRHRLYITPNTLRCIPRLEEFMNSGRIRIRGIRGNGLDSLVMRGLKKEDAESIILAKELNAKLYARNRKVEIIAWDNGVEVLDYVERF